MLLYHSIGKTKYCVNHISDYWATQRLFCIKDRHLPYYCFIEYDNPHTVPIFGHAGVQDRWIMTKARVIYHIDKINMLKNIIEKEEERHKNELINTYSKISEDKNELL